MTLRHLPETHRRELLRFVQSHAQNRGTTPERSQGAVLAADVVRVVRLPRELNAVLLGVAAQSNITSNRIIADALREYFMQQAT